MCNFITSSNTSTLSSQTLSPAFIFTTGKLKFLFPYFRRVSCDLEFGFYSIAKGIEILIIALVGVCQKVLSREFSCSRTLAVVENNGHQNEGTPSPWRMPSSWMLQHEWILAKKGRFPLSAISLTEKADWTWEEFHCFNRTSAPEVWGLRWERGASLLGCGSWTGEDGKNVNEQRRSTLVPSQQEILQESFGKQTRWTQGAKGYLPRSVSPMWTTRLFTPAFPPCDLRPSR